MAFNVSQPKETRNEAQLRACDDVALQQGGLLTFIASLLSNRYLVYQLAA